MQKQIFFISTSGNDKNNGLSEQKPWKTINKINETKLQPGNEILYRCGDSFLGKIDLNYSGIAGSPIIISSYREGVKPVITGALRVENRITFLKD